MPVAVVEDAADAIWKAPTSDDVGVVVVVATVAACEAAVVDGVATKMTRRRQASITPKPRTRRSR